MRGMCLGVALLLSAVSAISADPARVAVPAQPAHYGDWQVVVSQDKITDAKTYQLVNSDRTIVASLSPIEGQPVSLRTFKTSLILKIKVDRNLPLSPDGGFETSSELLRQMLTGKQLVVEYREWPQRARKQAKVSLNGFADAWLAATAAMRERERVPVKIYEPCDDDYYCHVWTFCENAATPYCSSVTSTCQCPEPVNQGGGVCNPVPCGQGQSWNASACTCECPNSCAPGQWQHPGSCECDAACENPGCALPKNWSYGTCTCVCPPGSPTSCPARTRYDDDLCACVGI